MFCPAQVLFSAEGANMVQDEFVETQYYTELDSIDKQHHTVQINLWVYLIELYKLYGDISFLLIPDVTLLIFDFILIFWPLSRQEVGL